MADGVWKGVDPLVFGRSRQRSLNKFFDPSAPSMRKVDDGGKKERKKIMSFLVATNVVASWPPERRPTGTPHARAKIMLFLVATNVIASRPPERRPTGTLHTRAN